MRQYDAVVIGGGIGGLAAAATLAKQGISTAVLEKNPSPGGAANSFIRGRFEFEVSLHELCGFGPDDRPLGSARKVLDRLGLSDRVEWVRLPEAYRLITFDEACPIDAVLPFGTDAYIKAVERNAPGSEQAVANVFRLAAEIRAALSDLGKARTAEERKKTLLSHPDFLHIAAKSVDDGFAELGMPKRAADILKGYWAYLFTDCEELSFLHYVNMLNSYIELGSVVPKHRSLALTGAFCDCIRENGSDVFTNAPVRRIRVENGAVAGVETENGSFFPTRTVICDISPAVVYGRLLAPEQVPAALRRKTNARELSGRGFCVYLGLSRSAEELGLNQYSWFIYPDMDTRRQYRDAGSIETNRIQNTVCQNAADPGASPPGTSILTMTTLFSSDCWSEAPERDYHRQKDAFARSMIDTFERATGIRISPYIEEMEAASPLTFSRYLGAPGGAIYGYRAAAWDSILARKMMDGAPELGGLYFAGGFGMNLNGYSSAMSSGMDAADRAVKGGRFS